MTYLVLVPLLVPFVTLSAVPAVGAANDLHSHIEIAPRENPER